MPQPMMDPATWGQYDREDHDDVQLPAEHKPDAAKGSGRSRKSRRPRTSKPRAASTQHAEAAPAADAADVRQDDGEGDALSYEEE